VFELIPKLIERLEPVQALIALCLIGAIVWLVRENRSQTLQLLNLEREYSALLTAQEREYAKAILRLGKQYHENVSSLIRLLK
jgi:hypothetical protein